MAQEIVVADTQRRLLAAAAIRRPGGGIRTLDSIKNQVATEVRPLDVVISAASFSGQRPFLIVNDICRSFNGHDSHASLIEFFEQTSD